MAKPRVFISSTYYDLKHIRSSLEDFIKSLGYEPISSPKGDIAYIPDDSLEESCCREVRKAHMFVMIIGGRYGSAATSEKKKPDRKFFERYDSVTVKEYTSAVDKQLPIYVLIDRDVLAEYQTFLRCKDKTDVPYAHVDSVNIFYLIENILLQPRGNPVQPFERYSDIEEWLKEQWAGFFEELLIRRSGQERFKTLSSQVAKLTALSETLKTYLEEVVSKIVPGEESARLIEAEEKRLAEENLRRELAANYFVDFLVTNKDFELEHVYSALSTCTSPNDFGRKLQKISQKEGVAVWLKELFQRSEVTPRNFNEARLILGLPKFHFKKE